MARARAFSLIVEGAFAVNNETEVRQGAELGRVLVADTKDDDGCLGAGQRVSEFDGAAVAAVQMMNAGATLPP